MPYGDSMSYLPAMSRLMGEVEQPTNTQGMTSPQFGGSPEQLMGMMQSPHMQQMLQQWGIHFDPSQMRQSPFLPNSFMQGHPQLGHALSGAMANVAATPEAPLVSGAGSGMTRAMQGMMGGPELQRQFQVRQMLAPMQMIGQQMPTAEFGRKQQLLDLLSKMEQDRQGLAQNAQSMQQQKPTQTPYGLIMPGHGTPVPPEMQGQSPRSAGMGTQPLMGDMFPGQGQQQFQNQAPPSFQPYDPNMVSQFSKAKSAGAQGIAETGAASREKVAGIGAESREKVAQTGAGSREKVANIGAGAKRDVANIGAGTNQGKRYDQQKKDTNDRYNADWMKLSQDYIAASEKGDKATMDAIGRQMQVMHDAWQGELQAIDKSQGPKGQANVINPGAPQNAQPRPGGGQASRPGGTGGPGAQATAPAPDPTSPDFWRNAPPPQPNQ
jgi:hypothetical protein